MRFAIVLCLLVATPAIVPVDASISTAQAECSANYGAEYKAGWRSGWPEGYRHVAGKHIRPPATPYPPAPNRHGATWQDGYNDGFMAGRRAAGG